MFSNPISKLYHHGLSPCAYAARGVGGSEGEALPGKLHLPSVAQASESALERRQHDVVARYDFKMIAGSRCGRWIPTALEFYAVEFGGNEKMYVHGKRGREGVVGT